MEIKQAVIHHIKKERHAKSSLRLRDKLLAITAPVEHLVVDIRDIYNKRTGKTYGAFQSEKESFPFQGFINEYTSNGGDFLEFSKKSASHYKVVIDGEGLATGGYLLFIDYSENGSNFVMVLMLYDKIGSSIDQTTLEIKDAIHLDLEKLHFACRVNNTKWKGGDSKYITFIKGARRQGDDLSKYFVQFIGCTDMTAPKDSSQKLIKAVNAYVKKNNWDTETALTFKNKVFEFCDEKAKEGKPVSLDALSCYLDDENPADFLEFANGEEHGLDAFFDTDRNEMRRLKRYSFRSKDLSISFSNNLLNKQIFYNSNDDVLTIKNVPEDLKKQLKE